MKDYFSITPFNIPDTIKSLPYAMQIVEHNGSKLIMVLAHADNQQLTWLDSENNSITTFNGKIINTGGLTNNIEIINPPNLNEIFLNLQNNSSLKSSHTSKVRFLDPETNYLELIQEYKIQSLAPKTFNIAIDGAEVDYLLLEENFSIPSILWKGKNVYWISLSGKVLKSKQLIAPNLEKFYLETLKDYRG